MRLRYRGITYDRTPTPVETTPIEPIGKYRGATLYGHQVTPAVPQPQTRHCGKYRGVDVVLS